MGIQGWGRRHVVTHRGDLAGIQAGSVVAAVFAAQGGNCFMASVSKARWQHFLPPFLPPFPPSMVAGKNVWGYYCMLLGFVCCCPVLAYKGKVIEGVGGVVATGPQRLAWAHSMFAEPPPSSSSPPTAGMQLACTQWQWLHAVGGVKGIVCRHGARTPKPCFKVYRQGGSLPKLGRRQEGRKTEGMHGNLHVLPAGKARRSPQYGQVSAGRRHVRKVFPSLGQGGVAQCRHGQKAPTTMSLT